MDRIIVHPRVHERHPEVTEKDALQAWLNCIRVIPRSEANRNEYIAVGVDESGRVLELVAKRSPDDRILIYHAMTPPTKKALVELGLIRR